VSHADERAAVGAEARRSADRVTAGKEAKKPAAPDDVRRAIICRVL